MARRKAQTNMVSATLLRSRRAPLGAPIAAFCRTPGPAFDWSYCAQRPQGRSSARPSRQSAPDRDS